MKRTRIKPISDKQKAKQANWNRLITFLSCLTAYNGFYQTDCCNQISATKLDGAHIIGKTRAGCTWTAKNCLLVSRWCGCHSHQEYADGLRMGVVVALEVARQRNEKYNINPNYDGSKGMNPYLEVKAK